MLLRRMLLRRMLLLCWLTAHDVKAPSEPPLGRGNSPWGDLVDQVLGRAGCLHALLGRTEHA
jgi:hypothetical protein